MRICVLASGSSGNCTVVRAGGSTLMIDAGIGPRTAARRLEGAGLGIGDVTALLLTHLDRDHFSPHWFATLERHGVRAFVHRRHLHAFYRSDASAARGLQRRGLVEPIGDDPFAMPLGGGRETRVTPFLGDHDRLGTVGYRIASPTGTLSFATDLGRVSESAIGAMTDVDILAIESNYDPGMQLASPRPAELKRRIMGGRGHLSNEQAQRAVALAAARSTRPPVHVVLLHLSRECNHPELARRAFDAHPPTPRLCIASQTERTPWLDAEREAPSKAGEQLTMW